MSRNIFQYFDELISIKEKMEIQKENELKGDETTDKNNFETNIIINNEEIEENIDKNQEMIEFFNFAKFNLSVCIEEIISDEEKKQEE